MIDEELLLAWGATYKYLDPEETLFLEGSACNYYYQVVGGQLRWVNVNEEGREYIQTIVNKGECIGELPLFDGQPYAATSISNGKSIVIRLPKNTFHELIKQYPDVHFSFSKLLTNRLRFKFFMAKEIAQDSPEQLILNILKYFKRNGLHICPDTHQVKLTRQQIADFTGLRIETVIRVIRNLNQAGQLTIERGKVFFKDMIPVIMFNTIL